MRTGDWARRAKRSGDHSLRITARDGNVPHFGITCSVCLETLAEPHPGPSAVHALDESVPLCSQEEGVRVSRMDFNGAEDRVVIVPSGPVWAVGAWHNLGWQSAVPTTQGLGR